MSANSKEHGKVFGSEGKQRVGTWNEGRAIMVTDGRHESAERHIRIVYTNPIPGSGLTFERALKRRGERDPLGLRSTMPRREAPDTP